jgi:hypothetical protein
LVTREFTLERRMAFLHHLRKTGLLYNSAERAGITMATVNTWRKKDPDFNDAVDNAKNRYVDDVLLREATRRAVDGVQKPIIGGRFRDEVVATETVYSDTLMCLLIKAARPEFRDSHKADFNLYEPGQGGVFVIPASPASPEQWEEQHKDNANPK